MPEDLVKVVSVALYALKQKGIGLSAVEVGSPWCLADWNC